MEGSPLSAGFERRSAALFRLIGVEEGRWVGAAVDP